MNYGEFIPLIECEINRSRVGDFYNKNSTVYDCDTGEVTDFLQLFDKGESNKVFCSKTLKHRPSITILGDSNFVFIGKGCKLANLKIKINSSNNFVFIGNKVTTNGNNRYIIGDCFNDQTALIINEDAMFATDVNIRTADGHPILDVATGSISNKSKKPLVLGSHVWVGEGVRILKSTSIPSCSIISSGAVVAGVFDPAAVFKGNPATAFSLGDKVWARDSSKHAHESALKYYYGSV